MESKRASFYRFRFGFFIFYFQVLNYFKSHFNLKGILGNSVLKRLLGRLWIRYKLTLKKNLFDLAVGVYLTFLWVSITKCQPLGKTRPDQILLKLIC